MEYKELKEYFEQTNQMHFFSECKDSKEIEALVFKLLPPENQFDLGITGLLDFCILTDISNHAR